MQLLALGKSLHRLQRGATRRLNVDSPAMEFGSIVHTCAYASNYLVVIVTRPTASLKERSGFSQGKESAKKRSKGHTHRSAVEIKK